MSKSVLVVCSSEKGSDYPAKDNQDMLNSILKGGKPTVDFLPGEGEGSFPQDMPKGKLYDLILFAGCNALIFIGLLKDHEDSIGLLSKSLKKNGVIVVTESEKFIKKYISEKHYDDHKLTVKLETLLKKHPSAGIQDRKDEFNAKIDYWNTKFKAQQTKKDKYIVYLHAAPKANTTKKEAPAAAAAAPPPPAKEPQKEDKCEKLLEKLKGIVSAGGVPTKLMESIRDALKEEEVVAAIGRKGTAKKTKINTSNINALSGEEACKDKLRAIKIALEDTANSAEDRVKEIRIQAGLAVRSNKTAKISSSSNSNSNSAQTPEADFFDRFEADDPSNRELATLNQFFKVNLLEDDAVYDREDVEKAAVLKSGAEKTTFSVEQGKEIKQAIIRKNVLKDMEGKPEAEKEAAVQAKITEEAAKSLADFRLLYGDFAGGCEDVKITLECMHASGNNSDCFFHSFFGATCEFYRMAKATGKPYTGFVTRFRKEIVPKIIEFFFAEEDDDKPVVTMSAEDLIEELSQPGQFLPDDLYIIISYYYNCAILLVRPKAADGIRVAPLIGENTDATYGISNSAGVHFEPLRIEGQNTYKLSDLQAKCLSYTYSQLSGTTATVDIKRFKEMGKVVPLNKPGADGAMAYDEEAMLAAGAGEEPGDVTRVYMGIKGEGYDETKTAQVRRLQEMIQRLTKNYKDRQMYENVKLAPQSQDLEDTIQVLQQGIVDGNKGEADIAAKEAEVAAFVQTLTKKEKTAAKAAEAAAAKKAKAEEAAAAKKAKAEAKKAAKKGGRRTVRKERRGRKTPRA